MALVIEGRSRCLLCGEVLAAGETITAFPAFLVASHPLGRFSDAAMHMRCFRDAPERGEVEREYAAFRERWDGVDRRG